MKILFTIIIAGCLTTTGLTQTNAKDSPVQLFYAANKSPVYWLSSPDNIIRAEEWITAIEAARDSGLISRKIMTGKIRTALLNKNTRDETIKAQIDLLISSAVFDFIKELQQIDVHFDYDEITTATKDSVYVNQILNSGQREPVSKIVSELGCQDHDYLVLKKFLQDSVPDKYSIKYKSVVLSMNYLKYIAANRKPEYIMVNIPETQLRYFKNSQLALAMKTVVGKKKTPTPLLSSHITNIVTLPYWNVPFSIATKELIPKIQKDENHLKQNNFEVIDAKGNPVDETKLNWANYNETNFPYFFREATGPQNTLGVLKFNLQNPFSIYLHDTNVKSAFTRKYRFLSHGCIRLEKPIELASLLADGQIDTKALKNAKKDTDPKIIRLTRKVPVFIVYMPVIVDGEKVVFLKDEYGLVK